jgi:hypothetical protein
MDRLINKMQQKGVLLDTNLFILMIVGLVGSEHIATHKKLNAYSELDFKLLAATLATCRKLVVTPHVLAETSNLVVHGMRGELETRAYLTLQAVSQADNFMETHDSISAIVLNAGFTQYGVSDIGLLEALKDEFVLLTDDFKLSGYAEGMGYDVLNYKVIQYVIADYLAKIK